MEILYYIQLLISWVISREDSICRKLPLKVFISHRSVRMRLHILWDEFFEFVSNCKQFQNVGNILNSYQLYQIFTCSNASFWYWQFFKKKFIVIDISGCLGISEIFIWKAKWQWRTSESTVPLPKYSSTQAGPGQSQEPNIPLVFPHEQEEHEYLGQFPLPPMSLRGSWITGVEQLGLQAGTQKGRRHLWLSFEHTAMRACLYK